jgi:hypothetical protein
MGIKFNPLTGQFDITGGAAAAPVTGAYNVDMIVVSAGQEAAKEVILSSAPTTATNTLLLIQGGVNQFYGDDYTVSGSTLSWNGLALDGILAAGDKLTIIYD